MTTAFRRQKSPIHGWGCYTIEDLEAGSFACPPSYEIKAEEADDRSVWVEDKAYNLYNPFCYLNHSKTANAELTRHAGRFYLEFTRRIEAGEEITFDYGEGWSD
jgi:SET domain-containing protein